MPGRRIPKLVTQCPSCPRVIGVRPDMAAGRGWYRVAAHPGCGGGGIRVSAGDVQPNPPRKVS